MTADMLLEARVEAAVESMSDAVFERTRKRVGDVGALRYDVEQAFRAAGVPGLLADNEHWKSHAEEAGAGFAQVCRDMARVTARNVELSRERDDLYAERDELRAALKRQEVSNTRDRVRLATRAKEADEARTQFAEARAALDGERERIALAIEAQLHCDDAPDCGDGECMQILLDASIARTTKPGDLT